LLLAVGERGPGRVVVLPLLQEQDGATGTWSTVGHQDQAGCLRRRGVLGPVDEPGQVTVTLVGPAVRLVGERDEVAQRLTDGRTDIEGTVALTGGDPDQEIVLGGRHRVAVRTDDRLDESGRVSGRGIRASR